MIDDMGRCAVASRAAKPLIAGKAFDNAGRGVNTAVAWLTELVEAYLEPGHHINSTYAQA
jgi:hypothetical protein